jgi:hypothetical protein
MENTPVAPAAPEAPVSEAPINSNPAPAAPAAQAAAPATPTPVANIPADKIEAFNKFIDANGGYDKAFAKLKSDVSSPAQQQPQQVQQPQQATQRDVEMGNGPFGVPKGYVTPQEVAAEQYFMSLANKEEYAPIADEIRSGSVLKEMSKFGIRPVENGMFNDAKIRNFLNLYAKTKPAVPTTETITTTPTVDYVNVGEQVTSRDDALKILAQNRTLG